MDTEVAMSSLQIHQDLDVIFLVIDESHQTWLDGSAEFLQ